MNSGLFNFNSGHARNLKVVKNIVSVSSRDISGLPNPDKCILIVSQEGNQNPPDTIPNSRELLSNDCNNNINRNSNSCRRFVFY